VWEVARAALKLGLTSFGGPIAHLGYFHREYVLRRRWLDEGTYGDLVALSQCLPGPASSQLGIAIGTVRAGPLGGLVAWLGFTLPSAIALVLFAQLSTSVDLAAAGWVHGLKLAAVAVVARAVLTMWRGLAPDLPRSAIAIAAAGIALLVPSPAIQVILIAGGGLFGWRFLRAKASLATTDAPSPFSRRAGTAFLGVFVALLIGLPILRALMPDQEIAVVESFYRAGALVFGGGHLVLPLLRESVVPPGWVSDSTFLAGYGAAQAVPGPLFTFAAYLGAVIAAPEYRLLGAAAALVAIFLPSFLLIWGVLPFWHQLRGNEAFGRALTGTSAAVVGILLAALYQPIWVTGVTSAVDAVVAIGVFALLAGPRIPAWTAVLICAAAGEAIGRA
jgi:chromate transporter